MKGKLLDTGPSTTMEAQCLAGVGFGKQHMLYSDVLLQSKHQVTPKAASSEWTLEQALQQVQAAL